LRSPNASSRINPLPRLYPTHGGGCCWTVQISSTFTLIIARSCLITCVPEVATALRSQIPYQHDEDGEDHRMWTCICNPPKKRVIFCLCCEILRLKLSTSSAFQIAQVIFRQIAVHFPLRTTSYRSMRPQNFVSSLRQLAVSAFMA